MIKIIVCDDQNECANYCSCICSICKRNKNERLDNFVKIIPPSKTMTYTDTGGEHTVTTYQ